MEFRQHAGWRPPENEHFEGPGDGAAALPELDPEAQRLPDKADLTDDKIDWRTVEEEDHKKAQDLADKMDWDMKRFYDKTYCGSCAGGGGTKYGRNAFERASQLVVQMYETVEMVPVLTAVQNEWIDKMLMAVPRGERAETAEVKFWTRRAIYEHLHKPNTRRPSDQAGAGCQTRRYFGDGTVPLVSEAGPGVWPAQFHFGLWLRTTRRAIATPRPRRKCACRKWVAETCSSSRRIRKPSTKVHVRTTLEQSFGLGRLQMSQIRSKLFTPRRKCRRMQLLGPTPEEASAGDGGPGVWQGRALPVATEA